MSERFGRAGRLLVPAAAAAVWLVAGGGRLAAQSRAPLEGPLTRVVVVLTDDDSFDDLEFVVTRRPELSGEVLPGAAAGPVLALLDSGAATHVLNYQDAVDLGLDDGLRTGNTFGVGGIGCTLDVDVSRPLGVFVHGVQDLGPDGQSRPALLVGQGNCPVAANTEANHQAGGTLPSALGLPLLAFYPVAVCNSRPRDVTWRGERIRTASVTFHPDPADPTLPVYPHRVPLEFTPAGDTTVLWLFDFFSLDFTPTSPAIVGYGSLLRTASSNLRLTEGAASRTVKLIVDTAAQATLLSENVAIDLGFILTSPEFEVEVQGICGSETVPGFYLDQIHLPTGAGGLDWSAVPVLVRNVTGPEGAVVDGILGSNLLGDRDYVINAAVAAPYLELSAGRVEPRPEATAIRRMAGGLVEVDWHCQPAAPELRLEMSADPGAGPDGWSVVAGAGLSTIRGTLSCTTPAPRAFFRLVAVGD